MLAQRLIERKRDGGRLESGEWRALTLAYASGHIPDYQMAAFLMACFLRGLDREETAALTAASIMSKKLAEDLTGLVLDIKRGSGSFLPQLERDLELAEAMIRLGSDHDCPVVALVTAMDRPLGRACGNALEVEEAIATLKNEGPSDLMEVTYALGAEMLVLAEVADDVSAARRELEKAIVTGRAAERF